MAKKKPNDNLKAGSLSSAASTREFPNRSLSLSCFVRSMPYLAATYNVVNTLDHLRSAQGSIPGPQQQRHLTVVPTFSRIH
jgi:hypothetical protein